MKSNKNTYVNSDIFILLSYLAIIDGELHENELDYLQEVSFELDIDNIFYKKHINNIKIELLNDPEKVWDLLDSILDKFKSNKDRIYVLGILSDLATKDLIIHESEIKFLNYVSKKWGIKAVYTEEIVWDKEQKKIIEADSSDKIAVSAGPGTGKTAVACARVSSLLDRGLPASSILMLSFTRTAIKELTDRINSFVESENTAINLRITTIDSRAWSIRYGFTDEEVGKLFGSFDANIDEAINKLKSDDQRFKEYLNSINHIIIDEAQDINGIRSEFIDLLISKLSPNCGVTIFFDEAQAIYGFSEGGEEYSQKGNFIEYVGKYVDESKFAKLHLNAIKRTESEQLQKLFTDLRVGIFGFSKHTKDEIDFTIKSILSRSIKDKDLPSDYNSRQETLVSHLHKLNDNDLFLFRKKSEVLEASNIALKEGISHRIRIGGMPQNTMRSVIGLVFSEITEPIIEINEFRDLVKEKFNNDNLVTEGYYNDFIENIEFHFKKINVIHLNQLRKVLSRPSPPVEFTYLDFGHTGPVLGTIHASKGRESENVLLTLPPIEKKIDSLSDDHIREEIKILYVGSTRPKKKLTSTFDYSNHFNQKSTSNDRVYRAFYKKRLAVFEIGKQNDVDEYSLIHINNFKKATHANSLQNFLKENFLEGKPTKVRIILDHNDYKYKVYIEQKNLTGKIQQLYLCDMSAIFKKDVRSIAYDMVNRQKYPNIQAYITGTKTYVSKVNDPRLSDCVHPYNISGIWLVPIIRGFSFLSFKFADQ